MIYKREMGYDDFLTLCEKTPNTPGASRATGDREFTHTRNFGEAMSLARNGWPEGLRDIQRISESIWNVVGQKVSKTTFFYDVCGSVPDVDRFLTGEPENMIQFSEEKTFGRGKVVKLHVNGAASCGVSAKTMFCRGAAVVALIDALEKLGHSCEVWTADAIADVFRGDDSVLQYEVELRGPGSPIDMDRMAFSLAHPSWLRRLCFSAMEQEPDEVRRRFGIGRHYGYPTESRGLTGEEFGIDVPSLRMGEHHWETQEAAIQWVLEAAALVLGRKLDMAA